jgi:hypothetical protein
MRWIRPRLARIAGGWLVFNLCLLASIPTAIGAAISAGAVGAECTCAHGDGQTCPMHHPQSTNSTPDRSCSCRSASDPIAALAASLVGPAAVLATPASGIAQIDASAGLPAFSPEPLDSSSVPDSPPPRA